MACRLFDAKPLSEPMLSHYQLDHKEHISLKNTCILETRKIIIQENAIENVVCKMVAILSWPQSVNDSDVFIYHVSTMFNMDWYIYFSQFYQLFLIHA